MFKLRLSQTITLDYNLTVLSAPRLGGYTEKALNINLPRNLMTKDEMANLPGEKKKTFLQRLT